MIVCGWLLVCQPKDQVVEVAGRRRQSLRDKTIRTNRTKKRAKCSRMGRARIHARKSGITALGPAGKISRLEPAISDELSRRTVRWSKPEIDITTIGGAIWRWIFGLNHCRPNQGKANGQNEAKRTSKLRDCVHSPRLQRALADDEPKS